MATEGSDGGSTTLTEGGADAGSTDANANTQTEQTPEQLAAAAKTAADVKAKADADAAAKAEISLKLPEGFKADDPFLVDLKGSAKKHGLKSEQAQEFADAYLKAHKAASLAAVAEVQKEQKAWKDALLADKEYGGKDFEANRQIAKKAIEKFGTPALKKLLDESGLGDHPELVRAFYRAGKALSEDSIKGTTGNGAAPATDAKAQLQRRYPTMFKES